MKKYKILLLTRVNNINPHYDLSINEVWGSPSLDEGIGFYDEDNIFRQLGYIEINNKTMDAIMYVSNSSTDSDIKRYSHMMLRTIEKNVKQNEFLMKTTYQSLRGGIVSVA